MTDKRPMRDRVASVIGHFEHRAEALSIEVVYVMERPSAGAKRGRELVCEMPALTVLGAFAIVARRG